jgi:hypothetical protein
VTTDLTSDSDSWFAVRRFVERLETLDKATGLLMLNCPGGSDPQAPQRALRSTLLRQLNYAIHNINGTQPKDHISQEAGYDTTRFIKRLIEAVTKTSLYLTTPHEPERAYNAALGEAVEAVAEAMDWIAVSPYCPVDESSQDELERLSDFAYDAAREQGRI